MKVINVSNLTYYYPDSSRQVLDDINLEIYEGEFVLIIGGSGSGKSSLLKAIKGLIPKFHGGKISGSIVKKESDIGIVFQNPEDQIVMTQVGEELVFGMENIGLSSNIMKRRLMEVSDALGLSELLDRDVNTLSGGQLQKIALASILCMQPEILLLDEPTSQLDPFAGEEILTLAKRLNEDNGMTVLLVEQRLERCLHLADRVIYMENGKIILNTRNMKDALSFMSHKGRSCIHPIGYAFAKAEMEEIPLTVKHARQILSKAFFDDKNNLTHEAVRLAIEENISTHELLLVKNLSFLYPGGRSALRKVNMSIKSHKLMAMLGENGAGKSTLVKLMAGILKTDTGVIEMGGKDHKKRNIEEIAQQIGYLSQNPNDYLMEDSVQKEIEFNLKIHNQLFDDETRNMIQMLGLENLLDRHPRDLSAGERQRVALATILTLKPQVLLLDEPTRGLDYKGKLALGEYLGKLCKSGLGILVITHDIEFAAEFSDEVFLMSRGEIVAYGDKRKILANSIFYSSQISKAFKGYEEEIVTAEDGVCALKKWKKEIKNK